MFFKGRHVLEFMSTQQIPCITLANIIAIQALIVNYGIGLKTFWCILPQVCLIFYLLAIKICLCVFVFKWTYYLCN